MRWKTAEYAGWGRVLRANGDMARPEKMSALRALWKEGKGPAVGKLRSYGDTPLNSGGRAIDMTRLDRLIAFDDETGVLRAEAGITIGDIARIFAPKGWIPTVMPGTGFATLGGCIANDIHGKSHHCDGSFGAHVISIDLMGNTGRVRRITADKSPDLFRATIGGLGQTGIIVSAEIQMVRCASEVVSVRETRTASLVEFMSLLEQSAARYSVGWIDLTARGATLGRGILEEGEFKPGAAAVKLPKTKTIPMDAPKFLLSPPVVRIFNQLYIRRVPHESRTVERSLDDFFFPLDRIYDWNRLYGKPGFYQFQCVLPRGGLRDSLTRIVERIANSGLASPLAVLKRFGPGQSGMLSFPMEGFTLAVDFPNRPKAAALIRKLNDMTLEADGRIYMAKDALATPDMVAQMYGELAEFQKIANAADPDRVFETDLTRRLNIRGRA